MKEFHRQLAQHILFPAGVLFVVFACVIFNYFIYVQHKKAEERRLKEQIESVKVILQRNDNGVR
jgi:hypothetical protein